MSSRLSRLWSQLQREKWLLLVCFVLAFISWQGIQRNIGFEVPVSNVVVDVKVPDGWAVWQKSISKVNIRFRGSREDIRFLNNEQMRVVIPITNPIRGQEMVVKLEQKFLKNPSSANVVRFNPDEITIMLDQESERLLPVKASVDGSLPEGLDIERIICTPASVRVKGAKQELDGMDNIHTESIDLKDRRASFKESARIAIPQTSRMRTDPEWVWVECILEMRSSTHVFEKVPVRILSAPGEHRQVDVKPQFVSVTVRGQQQRIEQVRPTELFAYVNCALLAESTSYDLPLIVDVPSGLQVVKTDPAVVHVQISTSN